MTIYDCEQWITDIDEIIDAYPIFSRLAGDAVLITGASGLICSAVADILIRWNDTHSDKIRIFAAGRDEQRLKERFSLYMGREWLTFVPYDASGTDNQLDFPCDYIIHGASNATPDRIVREPVETMLSNFMGMKLLLDYAVDHDVKRVAFISSSEIYGQKKGNEPFRPGEYGYIDLLSVRSSYAVGKRAAETLCASYADEYGVDPVIIRPGHIYGPTASISDRRVSSAWAFEAAAGRDIVMKSAGTQLRSYCYCLDCAAAVLVAMLCGKKMGAYNVSNPDSVITIREMAGILAAAADVSICSQAPSESERKSFNPMSNSSLDSSELLALGWSGLFDAQRGLSHTVSILRSMAYTDHRG